MESLTDEIWSSQKTIFRLLLIGCFVLTLTFAEVFTPQDAESILKKHNDYRRQESGADIYLLHWNVSLQQRADAWARRCLFQHERNPDLGENLFFDTDHENGVFLRGLEAWHDEKTNYGYTSRSCSAACHYTQLIWGYTTTVGCSANVCPGLSVGPRTVKNAMLLVCYYYPRGNFIGSFPYAKGNPCSKCAPGDTCSNGLCVTSGPVSKLAPEFVKKLAPQNPVSFSSSHSFQAFKSLIQEFGAESSAPGYQIQSSHRIEHHQQHHQQHFRTGTATSSESGSHSYSAQHHRIEQKHHHQQQQHHQVQHSSHHQRVFEHQQHRTSHWIQEQDRQQHIQQEEKRKQELLEQQRKQQEDILKRQQAVLKEQQRQTEFDEIRRRMEFEKQTEEKNKFHKEHSQKQEQDLEEGLTKHEAGRRRYFDLDQGPHGISYDHGRTLFLTNGQKEDKKSSNRSVDGTASPDYNIERPLTSRADGEKTKSETNAAAKIQPQGGTEKLAIGHSYGQSYGTESRSVLSQVRTSGTGGQQQVKTSGSSISQNHPNSHSYDGSQGESDLSIYDEQSVDGTDLEGRLREQGEERSRHLRKKWRYRQGEIRKMSVNHPHRENYVIETNGRRCVDTHTECARWAVKCDKSFAVGLSCPMTCGKCALNLGLDQIQEDQTRGNGLDRPGKPDRRQKLKRKHEPGRKEVTAAEKEAERLQRQHEPDENAPSALMARPGTQSDSGRQATGKSREERRLLRDQRKQGRQQQKQAKQQQKQARQQQKHAKQQKQARQQQKHAQQQQKQAQEQQRPARQEQRQERPGLCRDDPKHVVSCKFWAKKGFCLDNKLIGNLYCPLSCNSCR